MVGLVGAALAVWPKVLCCDRDGDGNVPGSNEDFNSVVGLVKDLGISIMM